MMRDLLRRFVRRKRAHCTPREPTTDRLDSYAKGRVDTQAAVDIFKGAWSSALPDYLGITAGNARLFDDPRIHWLLRQLGGIEGWQVLELGPLEGGHSYMLQEAGAGRVVSVDACAMSYLKCLIVRDLCQLSRVDFRFGDFMTLLAREFTRYDLIVASGVLYHQTDPLACIARVAQRSDRVFLWTHYYAEDMRSDSIRAGMFQRVAPTKDAEFSRELFRLSYVDYLPDTKYRGGVDDHVHWLRRDDILACLRHHGLTQIEIAFDQQEHPYGPNIALLAQRPLLSSGGGSPDEAYRTELRRLSGPEPWCIEGVRCEDGWLEVSGWAIPPGGAIGRMGFNVDGVAVQQRTCGVTREDVGAFYWFYSTAQHCGFHFRHALSGSDAPLELEYVDLLTGNVIEPLHNFHIRLQDLRTPPATPPRDLIQRSHCGNNEQQYLVEGYSAYCGILRSLVATIGDAAIDGLRRIVDFGCGPGRLARYLAAATGREVIAIDVDPACISWCSENLPKVHCMPGSLHPPLLLDTGSVDGIFAVQVLTHLTMQDARDWLTEWARWCRPGGVLALTIASDLALTRSRISAAHYASVQGKEFVVLSRNPDLDGVIGEVDYYHNVFYSHDHVRREWPLLGWDILSIVPGAVGNHYDLVILRRQPLGGPCVVLSAT